MAGSVEKAKIPGRLLLAGQIAAERAEAAVPEKAAVLWNNLGGVLQDLGDLAGERAAYERALGILENYLPEGHPNIQIVRGNLQALEDSRTGSPG